MRLRRTSDNARTSVIPRDLLAHGVSGAFSVVSVSFNYTTLTTEVL
ncbi:hypothetical protein D036_4928 [Vibrio parahaemolyticus VP232]|nr:hypothetical protein D036_4928 [Vibrio parahaemolyticus VP232]